LSPDSDFDLFAYEENQGNVLINVYVTDENRVTYSDDYPDGWLSLDRWVEAGFIAAYGTRVVELINEPAVWMACVGDASCNNGSGLNNDPRAQVGDDYGFNIHRANAVSEPSILALLGLGIVSLALGRRKA